MRILTVLWFITVLGSCRSDASSDIDRSTCKSLANPSPLMKLKSHILCGYDNTVRPVLSHKDVNNVTIRLIPKILEFDEMNGKMVLHSWMTLIWTDSFLTWSPKDYNGINYIHVKSDTIWMPDFSVYNSGDMDADQNSIPLTTCLVFSTGSVSCVPSLKHVAKCVTDFSKWPYDSHLCRINFGSWAHSGEEVDFHLDQKGFQMLGFTNNNAWDFKVVDAYKVLKKYKCCPNDTYPMIVYEFSIIRHHGIMQTTYVVPAVAMMLLTLTVLWLDSRSMERMTVGSVNLVCHMLCIFDLHWELPHNGLNTPNILLYYRDSLALAVFALILTAVLRKIHSMNVEAPYWISSTISFILNNRAGRFLILTGEDSKRILNNEPEDNGDMPKPSDNPKNSSWRHFAAIVEWISFFAVVFTYAIIVITLVPST